MKTETDPEEQAARLKAWLDMLEALPNDSAKGKERDTLWRDRLTRELDELQKELVRTQLNVLALLSMTRNALRGLIP